MTIKKPSEINAETDEITRAVKGAESLDTIREAKERLAGVRGYVHENTDKYQTTYGDETIMFMLKGIYDTGVFIGLKEIEITRREQAPQLRALGYKV